MTDRVYIGDLDGAMIARISAPGVDVKTAPFADRLFDGNGERWTRWMSGVTAYTAFINSRTERTFNVPYGRTFVQPPVVLFAFEMAWRDGNTPFEGERGGGYGDSYYSGIFSVDHGQNMLAQIDLSSVTFICQRMDSFEWSDARRRAWRFHYVVYDMEVS